MRNRGFARNHVRCGAGRRERAAPAFTLIEMMLVVAIIGILAAMLIGGATSLVKEQKRNSTRVVMNNILAAIEEFADKNPLASAYDGKNDRTFGKLPPYQLQDGTGGQHISRILEPNPPGSLSNRLWTDLSNGNRSTWVGNPPVVKWVRIAPPIQGRSYNLDDDNRSLYAYLAAFSRESLKRVPDANQQPLLPGTDEFINPVGIDTAGGERGAITVMGFYDAFGVPFDYMMYVKVGYAPPDATHNATYPVILDRKPVLRSHGVDKDRFAAGIRESKSAIWSEPLPQPWAQTGELPPPFPPPPPQGMFRGPINGTGNGWFRALPAGHSRLSGGYLGYRPDQDTP